MLIINQKGNGAKNFDTISDIFITEGNAIRCIHPYIEGDVETLGAYRTQERAKEVLDEIIKMYIDENVNIGHAQQLVYYMPQE